MCVNEIESNLLPRAVASFYPSLGRLFSLFTFAFSFRRRSFEFFLLFLVLFSTSHRSGALAGWLLVVPVLRHTFVHIICVVQLCLAVCLARSRFGKVCLTFNQWDIVHDDDYPTCGERAF